MITQLAKRFTPDETLSIPSRTREQRAVIEELPGHRLRGAPPRLHPWRSAQARLCQAQSQQENANARRRWLRALGVERHPVLSGIEAPRERAMALGREGPGRRHALAVVGKRALGCRVGLYGRVWYRLEGRHEPWICRSCVHQAHGLPLYSMAA